MRNIVEILRFPVTMPLWIWLALMLSTALATFSNAWRLLS